MGRGKIERMEDPGMEELGARIEVWRASRVGRSRMPEALWAEAVEWAGGFGASRVARALGIGYATLRRRLGQAEAAAGMPVESRAEGEGFVDLGLGGAWGGPSRVEVQGCGACRLSVQVGPGAAFDVAAVVSAFLRHAG